MSVSEHCQERVAWDLVHGRTYKSHGIEKGRGAGPMLGGFSIEMDGREMWHLFRVRDEIDVEWSC